MENPMLSPEEQKRLVDGIIAEVKKTCEITASSIQSFLFGAYGMSKLETFLDRVEEALKRRLAR